MASIAASLVTLPDGRRLTFRHLVPQDAAAFLDYRTRVPRESNHTLQYVGMELPSVDETARNLASRVSDPGALDIGAFDGERMVAYLAFRPAGLTHPWVRHIGQFKTTVSKEYWGCGVAKRLLRLQEDHALRVGITRIEAMVRVTNERGLRLYESFGYDIEGTRRRGARIDGVWHDEYFIAKILDCPKVSEDSGT